MQGFPLQSRGEERPGLQYSEASVWSLVDHVKTQRRLGPSGLLHWGEAGIGHVGQIRHSDRCPKSLHLKRPNGKEAGLEIKQGWHMCKRKKKYIKTRTQRPLKERRDGCWMGQLRSVQAPPAALDRRRSSSTFVLITALIFPPASSDYRKSRSDAYLRSRAAVNGPRHLGQRNNKRDAAGMEISGGRKTETY